MSSYFYHYGFVFDKNVEYRNDVCVPLTLRKTATHFKEKAQIFEAKRPTRIILDEDVEAELGERRYYAHFCPAYDL
jgi:hypothetical protein